MSLLDRSFLTRLLQITGLSLALMTASAAGVHAQCVGADGAPGANGVNPGDSGQPGGAGGSVAADAAAPRRSAEAAGQAETVFLAARISVALVALAALAALPLQLGQVLLPSAGPAAPVVTLTSKLPSPRALAALAALPLQPRRHRTQARQQHLPLPTAGQAARAAGVVLVVFAKPLVALAAPRWLRRRQLHMPPHPTVRAAHHRPLPQLAARVAGSILWAATPAPAVRPHPMDRAT